jgi:glycosyltransferase involved in cell wall biosynthesis
MKILQAVHAFPPSQGGIEHHVYQLSKEFVKLGNEVVVVTSSEKGAKAEEEIDEIKVRRLPTIKFPLFSAARLPIGSCIAMFKENADIYAAHGYGSIMPIFAALAAAARRKPFIFTLHGYPEVRGLRRIFYYFYRFAIAPWFLAAAKKIIIVSRATSWKIEKEVDKRKLVYVPNGIEEKFDCDADFSKKNKITYVGRLDEDKGIDVLIMAFAELKNKELELMIVGKDEGVKAKLEGLAGALGIKPIFSELPYGKIQEVYCQSKAIVLPSKYEGFSLVWLEAMASGRPIFSTPVGEAPNLFAQVYDEKKELFLFKDKEELVKKLRAFLANEKSYEKIVERAKYIIKEEYSWENVALQTLNVYKEAIR